MPAAITIRRFSWLLLLAVLSFLGACAEEAPVSLDQEARVLIDTMYIQEVRVLRPELDSLCELEFEDRVAELVDSLLPIRRAEEERLRQRIPILRQ